MTTATTAQDSHHRSKATTELQHAAIRFAGDSGDGMQLAGTQFTNTSAVFGNDVSTLPDFPAEIRAPAGTLAGVSGFQINFSSHPIHTPGDQVDALIAMNPAALRTNIKDLIDGGILIVNTDEFTATNLKLAKFDQNPLESGELKPYRVYKVPITKHTLEAVVPAGLGSKESARCRNFYALGLVFWLFDRPLDTTLNWIHSKFGKVPAVAEANTLALKAGYNFGETAELFPVRYKVNRARLAPGRYRNLTGNQALAIGLITAARKAGKALFYGSYPITPASDILHSLAPLRHFDVRTFQAEDEIAAIGSVIGAAFGGALAVTGTSGPGVALKSEAINLAVSLELPMIIVDVRRGGPSTGLPTKTEQADLLQAMFGRNGESPVAILAPATPADCFDIAIEAARLAVRAMTPVFILSEGFLANSAEPWRIPNAEEIPPIEVHHPGGRTNGDGPFLPYLRDPETLARPWALPGTPGLEHRVGGLSKAPVTGNVSYDPFHNEQMITERAEKIARLADAIPEQEVFGPRRGELLVVSWGGPYGVVRSAVRLAQQEGKSVAHAHLRYLNPFPRNLREVLASYKTILVPELNAGQLALLLRGRFGVNVISYPKLQARPMKISEVKEKIDEVLA